MERHWNIKTPDTDLVTRLSLSLQCHPITAALLINRDIQSEKEAAEFVNVSLNNLRSPFELKDMQAAVERIHKAITNHENILLFSDYDVDGITSTAILMDFLGCIGANVTTYIPHRLKEGYGLQAAHITHLAKPNNIDLVITADCGSTNFEAVAKAREFGVDVIITDHHSIGTEVPPALAVINPKRHDCNVGLENLAGVGVAFCLIICLRKYLRDKNFWNNQNEPNLKALCDLVALGTVADMVPLIQENRIFSKTGLDIINTNCRTGIKALLYAAGVDVQTVDEQDIAFRLAPRLNAAGRMAHAAIAVDLLTTTDLQRAEQIAQSLNDYNLQRRDQENKIITDIQQFLVKEPWILEGKTLVIWNRQWHEGVLGIVASRMVEKYYRPVVLIAVKDQICKGSARSIPGIDLYDRLSACEPVLEKFGGHAMAAGLSLTPKKLEAFRSRFEDSVSESLSPQDLVPELTVDQELEFTEISELLINEIESLAPFGAGNPEPVFMSRGVRVISSNIIGGHHRRMILTQADNSNAKKINAIQFNIETEQPLRGTFDRIAFKIRWNRWRGSKTAQLVIEDVQ
jgi:single-stranded-DNA-specific exonuclease